MEEGQEDSHVDPSLAPVASEVSNTRDKTTADDREALAKRILPEDVYTYFKEEYRGQFTDLRHTDDRPLI